MRYVLACGFARGRILDAACGCGYGSALLEQEGPVTGVDSSQDAIDWAEEYFKGPGYIQGCIEEKPWRGEYETVVSLETIEHLKDPSQALKAFRESCVGRFVASVPNEEAYPFVAENFAGDEYPHYRHYKPVEFEELLTSHGFEVKAKFTQTSKSSPIPVEGTDGKFLIYVCT